MSAALLAFVLGAVAHADDFSRVDVGDVVALEMEWRDRKKRRRETHVRLPAQDVALAEDTLSRRIYDVRFRDLVTGHEHDEVIVGTSGAVVWAGDHRTVFYVRQDETTLRPFQGWRYLEAKDVPPDLPDETAGAAGLPADLALALDGLGVKPR